MFASLNQFIARKPLSAPGAPTIGTATGTGATTATVSFTQPANNGGSAITSYTATSSPGGITGVLNQAGSGTITVTGLTIYTTYTFTVTATNAIGTSAASAASNAATVGVQLVDYAVVAGGGAGGYQPGQIAGGGGGAGGYKTGSTTNLTIGTTYSITVGAGGTIISNVASIGANSVFGLSTSVTSAGGGYGGDGCGTLVPPSATPGFRGGSGGGGGGNVYYSSYAPNGGSADPVGQGNDGGSGSSTTSGGSTGGGGGGAGGVGTNAPSGYAGGAGSVYAGATYAAGGAGLQAQGASTANTGNGGNAGYAGASGVVVFRTTDSTALPTSTTGSPTITVAGGYRTYTFTATGTITF